MTNEKYNTLILGKTEKEIFDVFNELNDESFHKTSSDDICTSMNLVKQMIDSIPSELWKRETIKVLDPCCGNGNFGAYCAFKTDINNIWFYDINNTRLKLCRALLNPLHIDNKDFLTVEDKFDLIMANPPYSGGGNKNRSLSNLFIEHAIDLLNDNGYLCFVTPNNWMTYNNNNTTLKKLLNEGSFHIINNDVKKYFAGVGSSFTVFVWQKNVFNIKTKIINNYLLKDKQTVKIPDNLQFIPLYVSKEILSVCQKLTQKSENAFEYRCDLHNFTKASCLSDVQDNVFKYETIHTARKTRYATFKQDIFDKWIIVIPLSTYYVPYIKNHVNTTQSVGYIRFDTKEEAERYLPIITRDEFKVIVHLTRYGNFNNIMVLKHLNFDYKKRLSDSEIAEITKIKEHIKY